MEMNKSFTHINERGEMNIVDISDKEETKREALAEGYINLNKEILEKIKKEKIKKGDIFIDFNDILLCFLWGAILNGFMNLVFIFSTRHLLASEVTFFMLIEFCLGPIWVWLVVKEQPTLETIIGGAVIIITLGIHSFIKLREPEKIIN